MFIILPKLRLNIIFLVISLVLIEKVLRMAPDVGKIYLLIKAKNKEAAIARLKSEVMPLCFVSFLVIFYHIVLLLFRCWIRSFLRL